MRFLKWILLVPLLVLGLVWFGHKKNTSTPQPLPKLLAVPQFEFVNQEGKLFTEKDLLGKSVLINFIFTKCPTVCPLLTQTMKDISEKAQNPLIHFVSISVDPENDSSTVLKAYGEKVGADFSKWTFLTGPSDQLGDVVVKGFKMILIKDPKKNSSSQDPKDLLDITHGEHFVLVDKQGYIRGFRTLQSENDKLAVLQELEQLAKESF